MCAQPAPPIGNTGEDPREAVVLLQRHLRSSPQGITGRDAQRRLATYGANSLQEHDRHHWVRDLASQFTHPLALLLWLAAALAAVDRTPTLAGAIVAVIVLNAVLAFAQEHRAERAVRALANYLPQQARVVRDGQPTTIEATQLVPGDVMVVEEGDRISADARILDGAVEVDVSALTGESLPVARSADMVDTTGDLLEARDLLFSGSVCTEGSAHAMVFATGMSTEIGRIASLTSRLRRDESPLERQVKRVAWLIAAVAVGCGLLFFPIGVFAAGMRLADAANFAIGLLVANVPEGLLPTITLALAVGVRQLARLGAVVKRLSAVETLGSTAVICTDKTGTLTRNELTPVAAWTLAGEASLDAPVRTILPVERELAQVVWLCNGASAGAEGRGHGDPTEVALLSAARRLGAEVDVDRRQQCEKRVYPFDPAVRLMSTVDFHHDRLWVDTKGAPEDVLARCTRILSGSGAETPLTSVQRRQAVAVIERYTNAGHRLIAAARKPTDVVPGRRQDAESDLCFLGVVAMIDPPRPEAAPAVASCHAAGIRIVMVTGDHPGTARTIARRVGIADDSTPVMTGDELSALPESDLDRLLTAKTNLIFARTSPEAKLRIADAFRHLGYVVAMTGDGVNDAPALRHADIGVAMGRSGTDVAREAAVLVLTDDNFATIVTAVTAGRRVYANVRKFILYIFTHAVPEVVPFLLYALSGGAIPLPMTVLQILAIDLGTDTVPALALGREPAEPGIMNQPPRPPHSGIITGRLLARAWGRLGALSAVLVLAGFFAVLWHGGWRPGADVSAGSPLHHAYLQATTMTFLGIVACQIGTAFAARTDRVSLRSIGVATNRLLLGGIAVEIGFAAALCLLPGVHTVFGTAAPPLWAVATLVAFPLLIWGSDETYRAWLRRRSRDPGSVPAGRGGAGVVRPRGAGRAGTVPGG